MSLFKVFFQVFQLSFRASKKVEIRPKTQVSSWKVRDRKGAKWHFRALFFGQKPYFGPQIASSFTASETSTEDLLRDAPLRRPHHPSHHGLLRGFGIMLEGLENLRFGKCSHHNPQKIASYASF